jgi:hypothetical protein
MEKEIAEMLAGVIERNTTAMEKAADASEKMSIEVRGLRRIIAGAQEKIGGELGAVIKRSKESARILHEEATAAVKARRTGG